MYGRVNYINTVELALADEGNTEKCGSIIQVVEMVILIDLLVIPKQSAP